MRRERSKEERERKNDTTEQMLPAVTECPGLGPMLGDTVLQVTGRERALARMRVKKRKSQAALLMSTFGLVLAKAGAKNRLRRLLEWFKGNCDRGRKTMRVRRVNKGEIEATLLRLSCSYRKGILSDEGLRGTTAKLAAICPDMDVSWAGRLIGNRESATALLRRMRTARAQILTDDHRNRVFAQLCSNWAAVEQAECEKGKCDTAVLDATRESRTIAERKRTARQRGKCRTDVLRLRSECCERITGLRAREKTIKKRKRLKRIEDRDRMLGALAPSAPHMRTASERRDNRKALRLRQQPQRLRTAQEKWEHRLKTGVE
jgi:hypothetical protein